MHAQEPSTASFASTSVDKGEETASTSKLIITDEESEELAHVESPVHPLDLQFPPPQRPEPNTDSGLIPPVVPPEHTERTLVLCFDGTGDHFDHDNSNIVQFVSLLAKNDRRKQMVYYQTGIGTYTSPKIVGPMTRKFSKVLDEMVAWNLDTHVMGGYQFLMQNYIAGDKICIFGFSRGAYTARSLAGMIHKVGLLPADNWQQVPFAYEMYKRTDKVGWAQSNEFKDVFSVDVDIEFVGVWDTVDSVGLIPKRLPFTTSNTIVHTFRHALSFDERRAKFKPNFWNRSSEQEANLGRSRRGTRNSLYMSDLPFAKPKKQTQSSVPEVNPSKHDKLMDRMERIYGQHIVETDVDEVWFAGCHCDVGGGAVLNTTRNSLSRIPLRWMIRECFKTNTGIMFDSERLQEIGLDPSTLYPVVTARPPPLPVGDAAYQNIPRTPSFFERMFSLSNLPVPPPQNRALNSNPEPVGTEEEEDLKDALSPMYDQLEITPSWWILEILPLRQRYQRGNNEWVSYFGANMARPRFVPKQHTWGVKAHRTVKQRMEAGAPDGKKKYKPRVELSTEPTWVD